MLQWIQKKLLVLLLEFIIKNIKEAKKNYIETGKKYLNLIIGQTIKII